MRSSRVCVILQLSDTEQCIDADFKDRWRTLLSVDDIISDTLSLVTSLGPAVLDNTYFIYSSDHGYSLGELNLNWDKRNVYDWDTRIHLLVRGPGVRPGSSFGSQLHTLYTQGTRRVHAGYTQGTRRVHAGYTQGTRRVHAGGRIRIAHDEVNSRCRCVSK